MIDHLYLYNFDIKSDFYNNQEFGAFASNNFAIFKLKTCQRLLLISYGAAPNKFMTFEVKPSRRHLVLKGSDAYQYILEVLCGLQSQLLGESEIVNQFKNSLNEYALSPVKNRNLSIILEKLLKDAKDIRTKYLSHIGQSTYASIAKKIIGKSVKDVLIIGTGHLALDLLQSLKKSYNVIMCARNQSKLVQWQQTAHFKTLPWLNLSQIENCPVILNTVGVPNFKIAGPEFFESWRKKQLNTSHCFIDFGSPSSVELPADKRDIYTLHDLFSHGSQFDLEKLTKIEQAKRSIEQTVLKRVLWLDQKHQRDQSFNIIPTPSI
jgi:glutamyl-tRNA reductase